MRARTSVAARRPASACAVALAAALCLSLSWSPQTLAAQAAAAPSAQAVSKDPATQARIKRLESELRCLVCQAQSIAESDSDFAHDIRREINRMIAIDSSDAEIKAFLVERYGDFILYRPPLQSTTLLLWAGPAILLLIGLSALGAVLTRRRRNPDPEQSFSEDERRRIKTLLAGSDDDNRKISE
jgi:cytochrome c-type biogenesis protein CcmH